MDTRDPCSSEVDGHSETFTAKVLFLGPPHAGKTTLQTKINGGSLELLQETEDAQVRVVEIDKNPSGSHSDRLRLSFWESNSPFCYPGTQLVVFVVDCTQTLNEQTPYLYNFKSQVFPWLPRNVPVILVANKADAQGKSRRLEAWGLATFQELLAVDSAIRVSAKTNSGVDALKKCIVGQISKHLKSKNAPKTAMEMLEEEHIVSPEDQIRFFFKKARQQLSNASAVMISDFTKKSGKKFKKNLKRAKDKVLADYRSQKITPQTAMALAEQSWKLAVQVGKTQVTIKHIQSFHKMVAEEIGESLLLGQIIGGLIGAAIGAFLGAFVGLLLGAGLGPGAAIVALGVGSKGAMIGVSLGAVIGGAVLGCGSSWLSFWRQPWSQMEKAAADVDRLKRLSHPAAGPQDLEQDATPSVPVRSPHALALK